MVVNGVQVIADPRLSREEINHFIAEEQQLWRSRNKRLGQVELSIDQEEVIVKATEKSPIRRVRRITGYLSSIDNFNDAKVAECSDRAKHNLQ
jgi:anaerobic ribonucleoside-triphosphate reductase activating protein